MVWRTILPWLAIGLIAAACASTATAPVTSAQQACAQKGGRWAAAAGTCEPGSGGGGY